MGAVSRPSKKTVGKKAIICAVLFFFSLSGKSLFAQATSTIVKQLQPQALDFVGIREIKSLYPNLNGRDVNIAVISRSSTYTNGQPQNDYRPDFTHNCLKNARLIFYDLPNLPAGSSPHSTAICSILFGKDDNGFNPVVGNFSYEGIVPQAGAHIYEFWRFLTEIVFPQKPPDCDIITASIGNCCEQWWTRGLDAMAQKYGVTVIAGIGNGSKAYDPPLYPAAGANVIGVGIIDSINIEKSAKQLTQFSLSFPEHSSFGPTADGRCKPDIVAPGNCLAGADNKKFLYEPTGSFSSFATPVVAGTAALLMQKAKTDTALSAALSPQSGNCVIKAILLSSATKLPFWHKGRLEKDDDHFVPLDFLQGAGMVNASAAMKVLTGGQQKSGLNSPAGWDLSSLDKNQKAENVYHLTIADANGKNLAATITWNKHYSPSYPFEAHPEKDADLRLEVWAINPAEPDKTFLLDYSDSAVDNLEHIYCRLDPNYTDYEIIVTFSGNTAAGNTSAAPYAIAWLVNDNQNQENPFRYDINTDGVVDSLDVQVLFDRWVETIKSPNYYFIGDINGDGVFDEKDIEILNAHINNGG
jgi:hypothetical protein